MIGKLSGIIDSFYPDHVILDVSGVGYLVYASRHTLTHMGQKGDAVSLLIDTHVREDHIRLYGFSSAEEQQWFRLLTSVQGVGVKAGLAILSACQPQELVLAISAQDKALITRADGVGPKLATRIITELKDKVGSLESFENNLTAATITSSAPANAVGGTTNGEHDQDAVLALVGLGYARSEAYNAVLQAKKKSNDNGDLQTLIKLSLKELTVE